MSQSWPGPGPAEPRPASDDSGLRQSAMIAYVLMLAGCVTAITAIIAVILAYIRRPDAAGTLWHAHFQNLIVVFWTIFVAALLGVMAYPLALGAYLSGGGDWSPFPALAVPALLWLIGFPVLAVWFLYRMIRGLVRASEGRPY